MPRALLVGGKFTRGDEERRICSNTSFPSCSQHTFIRDSLILVAVLDVAIKRLILASAFPEFADSVGEEITEQGYLFWKGRGHNGKSMYVCMGILPSLPCFPLPPDTQICR